MLSLYLHLPWCVRKCPYCDFNSFTAGSDAPKARYVAALIEDLRVQSGLVGDRVVETVYLGGGTPSFFKPAEIATLLDALRGHFELAADAEITMEANPSTVESGAPAGYRAAGVNRLSIGAQSFDDASLRTLGRLHSAADIGRAFEASRRAGFDNINVDIMYALPGQSVDSALSDLEAAVALGPEHLSWYQLTLEPNTVFYARPPAGLPDEELSYDIQQAGQALLADRRYRQYEVSAYARDGRVSRHNLNYWRFGDYLAIGAGAHGKLSFDGHIRRYARPANPAAYMQAVESAAPLDLREVGEDDVLFEFALMALRLTQGFSEAEFEASCGRPASRLRSRLERLRGRGLVAEDPAGHWRPTELGQRFLNDLQADFLPVASA